MYGDVVGSVLPYLAPVLGEARSYWLFPAVVLSTVFVFKKINTIALIRGTAETQNTLRWALGTARTNNTTAITRKYRFLLGVVVIYYTPRQRGPRAISIAQYCVCVHVCVCYNLRGLLIPGPLPLLPALCAVALSPPEQNDVSPAGRQRRLCVSPERRPGDARTASWHGRLRRRRHAGSAAMSAAARMREG